VLDNVRVPDLCAVKQAVAVWAAEQPKTTANTTQRCSTIHGMRTIIVCATSGAAQHAGDTAWPSQVSMLAPRPAHAPPPPPLLQPPLPLHTHLPLCDAGQLCSALLLRHCLRVEPTGVGQQDLKGMPRKGRFSATGQHSSPLVAPQTTTSRHAALRSTLQVSAGRCTHMCIELYRRVHVARPSEANEAAIAQAAWSMLLR
jgi:hypothetical protein